MEDLDRRALLMRAGLGAGLAAAAGVTTAIAAPGADPTAPPAHTIDFAVIGLDHYHIMGMTAAVKRGGGRLVKVYATDPKQIADFRKQFGDVPLARSEAEILEDPSIKLVAGAPIPDQRTPLGLRVMAHGKDYLSDKPAITTLEQLAEVRRAVKQTGRKFAVMYSERLEVRAAVKAGELVQAGAIGKVVQTLNIAPHQINAPSRPEWFWDRTRYGGILTDIGSH
jgi:predicted dehydrogenase